MKTKKFIGEVLEVFIPTEENGIIVDTMYSDKIGFKVKIDDREVTIIAKQNDLNADILRNDKVLVIEENGKLSICPYKRV